MAEHVHIDFYINSKAVFELVDPKPEEYEELFYKLLSSEIFDFDVKVTFWKGLK